MLQARHGETKKERCRSYPGCGFSIVMMGFRPSFLRFLVPEPAVDAPFAAELVAWFSAPFMVHNFKSFRRI